MFDTLARSSGKVFFDIVSVRTRCPSVDVQPMWMPPPAAITHSNI